MGSENWRLTSESVRDAYSSRFDGKLTSHKVPLTLLKRSIAIETVKTRLVHRSLSRRFVSREHASLPCSRRSHPPRQVQAALRIPNATIVVPLQITLR